LEFELVLKIGGEDGTASQVSLGEICAGKVDDVALLGLGLSESKQVLTRLQHEIVATQFESIAHARRPCACCGVMPSIKDYQQMRFHSLFGDIELRVPRYTKCGCADAGTGQREPQRRWISAELECVQSELAASLSYRHTSQVLRMESDRKSGVSSGVGERLCQRFSSAESAADPRLSITLDTDRPPSITCLTAASRNSGVYRRSGPDFICPPQGQK
jgi:hypothetical protein